MKIRRRGERAFLSRANASADKGDRRAPRGQNHFAGEIDAVHREIHGQFDEVENAVERGLRGVLRSLGRGSGGRTRGGEVEYPTFGDELADFDLAAGGVEHAHVDLGGGQREHETGLDDTDVFDASAVQAGVHSADGHGESGRGGSEFVGGPRLHARREGERHGDYHEQGDGGKADEKETE